MPTTLLSKKALGAFICTFGLSCLSAGAQGASFDILYFFHGSDGRNPGGSRLLMDAAGNLYGVTRQGGTYDHGTVFKLAPDGTETVLHSFGSEDDDAPFSGLTFDRNGNLYGGTDGLKGVIFRLAPDGAYSVIYRFPDGGADGTQSSTLVVGQDGDLYGETAYGGDLSSCANGCGTIFKLTPKGKYSRVYTFTGGSDGRYPDGGLIVDSAGNLYGTTLGPETIGDRGHGNWGTIFKLSPEGSLTVLHTFAHRKEGALVGGVTMDAISNLYGAAMEGGHLPCDGWDYGCGKVFRLAPNGTLTVLYAFRGGSDGGLPWSPPVLDAKNNLYGTTMDGRGAVYQISAKGKKTMLQSGSADALMWRNGSLYGTMQPYMYQHYGFVFKLTP